MRYSSWLMKILNQQLVQEERTCHKRNLNPGVEDNNSSFQSSQVDPIDKILWYYMFNRPYFSSHFLCFFFVAEILLFFCLSKSLILTICLFWSTETVAYFYSYLWVLVSYVYYLVFHPGESRFREVSFPSLVCVQSRCLVEVLEEISLNIHNEYSFFFQWKTS